MLACRGKAGEAGLVVDAGTAITLDVVDDQAVHQGGYILPGLDLAQRALLDGTAIDIRLPGNPEAPQAYATDTAAAISQGIALSVAAFIEKLFSRLHGARQVWLGGGDAERLAACLEVPHVKVEHMVLRGLARLASLEEK
jgi:type III pantothenate kinase